MTDKTSWFDGPGRPTASAANRPRSELSWADRFRGAMLGGAVGDALGAVVRHRTTFEIHQWFGQRGVVDYLPVFGRRGACTELTQLSVFTLEAMLRAKAVNPDPAGWLPTQVVCTNHLRWLYTQGVPWEYALGANLQAHPEPSGWLLERPELFSTRNPAGVALRGVGALAAQPPASGPNGQPNPPLGSTSFADCLAWAAPTMVWSPSEELVFAAGAAVANLLTRDSNVHGATGLHSDVLAQLIRGAALWDAVSAADTQRLGKAYYTGQTPADVRRTVHAAMFASHRGQRPDPAELDIEFDTDGKPGELGIALASVACSDGFADAVRMAVNQSADSCVTGSLAGQIAGAIHGPGGIPGDWLEELELREVIETLCDDAAEAFAPPPLPKWAQRYVGEAKRAFSGPLELTGCEPGQATTVDSEAVGGAKSSASGQITVEREPRQRTSDTAPPNAPHSPTSSERAEPWEPSAAETTMILPITDADLDGPSFSSHEDVVDHWSEPAPVDAEVAPEPGLPEPPVSDAESDEVGFEIAEAPAASADVLSGEAEPVAAPGDDSLTADWTERPERAEAERFAHESAGPAERSPEPVGSDRAPSGDVPPVDSFAADQAGPAETPQAQPSDRADRPELPVRSRRSRFADRDEPVEPAEPVESAQPVEPVESVERPELPVRSRAKRFAEPAEPAEPAQPAEPVGPTRIPERSPGEHFAPEIDRTETASEEPLTARPSEPVEAAPAKPPAAEPERFAPDQERFAAEPEPLAADQERFAAEPERFAPEPERFAPEPERFATDQERLAAEPERFATDQERLAAEPERFATEPERFAAEPERFAPEPEPLAAEPGRLAAEPERFATEPERFATEPEPFAPDQERFAAEVASPAEPEPLAAEPAEPAEPFAIEVASLAGGHAKGEAPASVDPSLTERVLGCFLGGGLGDALGADLELESAEAINEKFGPNGPQGLRVAHGVCGAITDDTQMTLFTAEGLIRGSVAQRMLDTEDPLPEVQLAYQRWLHTQGVEWESAAGAFFADHKTPDGWLVNVPGLFSTRAPGKTVFRALARFGSGQPAGSPTEQINNSKGCGGAVRAAPVALYSTDPAVAFELAARTAALTHSHPGGYLPAGALAVIVQQALLGQSLDDGVWLALQVLETWEGHEDTSMLLKIAVDLATQGVPTPRQVEENLGGGWVGDEALAVAVCAALVGGEDVKLALQVAVHHSGNSASTGAICGNIVGALLGLGRIPVDWLAELELRDVLERMALDCVAEFGVGEFLRSTGDDGDERGRISSARPTDEDWHERYPVRPLWSMRPRSARIESPTHRLPMMTAPEAASSPDRATDEPSVQADSPSSAAGGQGDEAGSQQADDFRTEYRAPKPAPRRINGVVSGRDG